jgi:hypothetical protein
LQPSHCILRGKAELRLFRADREANEPIGIGTQIIYQFIALPRPLADDSLDNSLFNGVEYLLA